jgi:hypothetical protein
LGWWELYVKFTAGVSFAKITNTVNSEPEMGGFLQLICESSKLISKNLCQVYLILEFGHSGNRESLKLSIQHTLVAR